MDMVRSVLKEELEHSLELRDYYEKTIDGLPHGALSKKKINGKEYYYLMHRNGSKVITDYVGNILGELAVKMHEDLNKRKHYKELLKEVKEKIRYLEKVLNV